VHVRSIAVGGRTLLSFNGIGANLELVLFNVPGPGGSTAPSAPSLGTESQVDVGGVSWGGRLRKNTRLASLIPNARLVTLTDGRLFLVTSAPESAQISARFLPSPQQVRERGEAFAAG
jgi:hypothetical protein